MGEVHVIITTKKVGDKGKIVNPPCKIAWTSVVEDENMCKIKPL